MVPVLLDCNFVVDPANGNGAGVRNVKGPGISNVFMHTTASFTGTTSTSTLITGIASGTATLTVGMPVQGGGIPAGAVISSIVSPSSITISVPTTTSATETITYQAAGSPNPEAGVVLVQLGENYTRYFGGFAGFEGPLSGTPIAVATGPLVLGTPYVIVSVGTTTQAQWVALGLPIGETAAVGVPFIAIATTTLGTGLVETQLASGVNDFELIGDPNATFANTIASQSPSSLNNTAERRPFLMFYIMGPTSASVTTPIPTAPAVGTTVGMAFYLSNSSVLVKGE
jgi:hypothetical protein